MIFTRIVGAAASVLVLATSVQAISLGVNKLDLFRKEVDCQKYNGTIDVTKMTKLDRELGGYYSTRIPFKYTAQYKGDTLSIQTGVAVLSNTNVVVLQTIEPGTGTNASSDAFEVGKNQKCIARNVPDIDKKSEKGWTVNVYATSVEGKA